ncbi:hypothetical protein RD055328_11710 [Companilactobacillus sp. RD055328]|uniref:YueI family protein n=1 Tax=Companilactobacillus sp. RD055328 TaxID=2916634 RepID=UPI001FC899B8|nr:YueI family protein [Companilactobacillus sp. RD055328]GKQ43248.1 hypothetical protein RD055328_11710 [Companilactobacillus sp. RD055328]
MEELEKYLKDNVFGKPQLKPDEKNKYLGNFQERVAIALTMIEAINPDNKAIVDKVMADHPDYHMYINGDMGQSTLGVYISLAAARGFKFTIIAKESVRVQKDNNDNEMGLVIADENSPVDRPVVL